MFLGQSSKKKNESIEKIISQISGQILLETTKQHQPSNQPAGTHPPTHPFLELLVFWVMLQACLVRLLRLFKLLHVELDMALTRVALWELWLELDALLGSL